MKEKQLKFDQYLIKKNFKTDPSNIESTTRNQIPRSSLLSITPKKSYHNINTSINKQVV